LVDLGPLAPIAVVAGAVIATYEFGEWLGKTISLFVWFERGPLGDFLGIIGGVLGLVYSIGYVLGEALS
jgi:hypothetical protein